MEDFIGFLRQYGDLTEKESALIQREVEEVSLPKDKKFAEASGVSHELWFLRRGVTRVYYYTDDGREVTKYFIDEVNLSSDANSFVYRLPMTAYVETVTNCELIRLSRAAYETFSASIPGWDALFLSILAKALIEKVNRISPMLAETGQERYLNFMERYPDLLNRIPLHLLASYIGVTKSSLSRIRKSIQPTHPASR